MTNLYNEISAALSDDFVKSADIARIISLAVEAKKNVLLWGPGGHGKSEMVTKALSCIATEDDMFVQSFGEGMDEATLWGGLDFRALDQEKVLRYFPENSFLAKPYAVFEEIFDSPAQVLLALKDTLTAKKMRKGAQVYAMKTKVIIACTNKDPDEISDLGPAAAALIERFPLQLKVEWPSYEVSDYAELFAKVGPRLPGPDLNGTAAILAEVFAKVAQENQPISPRTAVHALGLVKAAASLRGAEKVEKEDLLDLTFLPGMEEFAANLRSELDAAYERSAAEARIREAESKLQALAYELDEATTPIKALQVAKRLLSFQDEVSKLKVTDALTERRKNLRNRAGELVTRAQQCALDNTRI